MSAGERPRVLVAGHRGMVGSAISRALEERGDCEVLTAGREVVDLQDQEQVRAFMMDRRPDAIFLAAAKVGGILANDSYPADFIYQNLMIQTNVIHSAHLADVQKLVFLGSSCIYPKFAPQPLHESSLLTGLLEPTNEPYAVAKIAGIKMCESYRRQYKRDFVSAMPTNLYGPNDNFDLKSSHVLPALIRKFHEAKESNSDGVTLWGTGKPRREFMHVDDLAEALIFIMQHYSDDPHINVGYGEDIEIRELAHSIGEIVGFSGSLNYDTTKPDGTPRKLMDTSKLFDLGWKPKIDLQTGVAQTYEWFLANHGRQYA